MASCSPVWHQLVFPDGRNMWFRFALRINDGRGTYVYRMGPRPDDAACRDIWCSNDGLGAPWNCSACGELVSVPRFHRLQRAGASPAAVSGGPVSARSRSSISVFAANAFTMSRVIRSPRTAFGNANLVSMPRFSTPSAMSRMRCRSKLNTSSWK